MTGKMGETDTISQDSPLTSVLKITLSVFSIRLLRLVERFLYPENKYVYTLPSVTYSVVIFEKHVHGL